MDVAMTAAIHHRNALTMPQEDLKRTLQSLHAELSQHPSLDPESRDLLTRLAEDIDDVLHPAAPPPDPEQDSLIDRVTDARQTFEVTHPRLAAIIGRIADGLAQLGI
jgi:hypothetical protein